MNNQNTAKSKVKISPTEEVEVPLHFAMSTFLPSVVAQHMAIQTAGEHFVVSFFEANLPIMFNPTPESLEELKQTGYKTECVARITIPATRFTEMAKVFARVAGLVLPEEGEEQDANTESN